MNIRLPAFLAIFLTGILCAGADTLSDAAEAERDGRDSEAHRLYGLWLDSHVSSLQGADVLMRAAGLRQSVSDALELFEQYADDVPADRRGDVLEFQAGLESLLGDLEPAASHYMEAAAYSDGEEAQNRKFEAAALYFVMGRFEQARTIAVSLRSSGTILKEYAAALAGISLASISTDAAAAALEELKAFVGSRTPQTPLVWLALRKTALLAGDRESYNRAEGQLDSSFPASVEGYLVGSRVLEWNGPEALLNTAPSRLLGSPIQIGAFRERASAAELRRNLEKEGFTAWLERSGDFWRLFVNDPDGTAAARLRNAGYLEPVSLP